MHNGFRQDDAVDLIRFIASLSGGITYIFLELTIALAGIVHQVSRLPALLGSADAVVCLAGDCGHPACYAVKRY